MIFFKGGYHRGQDERVINVNIHELSITLPQRMPIEVDGRRIYPAMDNQGIDSIAHDRLPTIKIYLKQEPKS